MLSFSRYRAKPLWVINPWSQNCEFYVHVVSLAVTPLSSIFSILSSKLFLEFFSWHMKIANFFISLLNQLFWLFNSQSLLLLLREFLQRNKMKKIFIVDSDMYHNIVLQAKEVVKAAGYFRWIKWHLALGCLPVANHFLEILNLSNAV